MHLLFNINKEVFLSLSQPYNASDSWPFLVRLLLGVISCYLLWKAKTCLHINY